ncbi:rop guanine nucleotide exchange factor 14-like [Silene latifolia]|uniref:rop guanine nucleotide exchange factor 14-like n=1 Tax=Silene latifolia TaxID=37657 RepID=UPI003D77585C
MGVRRKLVCCTRDRVISIDFDENEQDRIITYDGLERCILNSQSYVNTDTVSAYPTTYFEEEETSCSSNKNVGGSFYSDWISKKDYEETDTWGECKLASPEPFYARGAYATQLSDVEAMKEKFSKLLLGDDVTGGRKGKTSALAISNAIINLAASVYGELWKLEPLAEEGKAKWIKEMNWLVSPANYMVELVPAKQSGTNGCIFEIMTPKARTDVHINIPALQKIDSMLIEVLDSMVGTEFWYAEGNSRKGGGGGSARQSKRWWLPYPQVPPGGLSETARKKLLSQGNVVHQVFKAAKSINENVLLEMTVPKAIQEALPKSGKANLGEELYKVIASGTSTALDMVDSLKLRSQHDVLDTINKLEAASLVWNERIKEHASSNRTPIRSSWSFVKETTSEADKIQSLLLRIDALLYQLKMRYPCLPHTFLNVAKVQFGQDVGHAILEAYSRVLGNLAYSILSRIGDILQEDYLSNPNTPIPTSSFHSGLSLNRMLDSPINNSGIRHSLVDKMNKVDGYFSDSNPSRFSDSEISSSTETKSSSVTATPSSSQIWRTGKDAITKGSPNSPLT